MITRLGNLLVALMLCTLLVGCKLTVVATSGGNVKSGSNTRDCTAGKVCAFDLAAGFSEEFHAFAKPGFKFVKWQQGTGSDNGGFLCGNSTNPVCFVQLPNDANGAAIAASPAIGYIMPVYCVDTDGDLACNSADQDDDNDGLKDPQDNCPLDANNEDGFGCPTGTPITNTVAADGKVWAQPVSFTDVTYAQIVAACPLGNCTGILGGYRVTGWTWANAQDVKHLVEAVRGVTFSCGIPCSYTGIFALTSGGVCSGACPPITTQMGNQGFTFIAPETPIEGWVNEAIGNGRAGFGGTFGGYIPPHYFFSEWFTAGTPGDGVGVWMYQPAAP